MPDTLKSYIKDDLPLKDVKLRDKWMGATAFRSYKIQMEKSPTTITNITYLIIIYDF